MEESHCFEVGGDGFLVHLSDKTCSSSPSPDRATLAVQDRNSGILVTLKADGIQKVQKLMLSRLEIENKHSAKYVGGISTHRGEKIC